MYLHEGYMGVMINKAERDRVLDEDEVRTELIEIYGWAWGEWIKKALGQRSEWDQGTWVAKDSCGTACCTAGKMFLQAGGTPIFENSSPLGAISISTWAEKRLSGPIEDLEWDRRLGAVRSLFQASNTLKDIRKYIERRTGTDPHLYIKNKMKVLNRLP